MAFTIPNYADAAFPAQAQVDSGDFGMWSLALAQCGVKTGCAVTAQGTPDLSVAVASGTIYWNRAEVAVASGNLTITTPHATCPRFDLVTVGSTGTKAVTAGTAAAAPVFPAIPASSIVLAAVYVPANDTAIESNQIVDKRTIIVLPNEPSSWTEVVKAADESVTSSIVLQNDDELFFSMSANTKYRIEVVLFVDNTTLGGFRCNFTGPASPTLVQGLGTHGGTSDDIHGSAGVPISFVVAQFGGTDLTFGPLGGTRNCVRYDLVVHNGANSGTFRVQWAQYVSNATATYVRAGSYIHYSTV